MGTLLEVGGGHDESQDLRKRLARGVVLTSRLPRRYGSMPLQGQLVAPS